MFLGDEHRSVSSLSSAYQRRLFHGWRGAALGNHLHLELRALHDALDDRLEAIVVLGGITNDPTHRWHVLVLDSPSERVGHQLLGDRLNKLIRALQQDLAHIVRALHIDIPPPASGIDYGY